MKLELTNKEIDFLDNFLYFEMCRAYCRYDRYKHFATRGDEKRFLDSRTTSRLKRLHDDYEMLEHLLNKVDDCISDNL